MSSIESKVPKSIKVFYQNSALHRTVLASGAWAGITPTGFVQVAIFNDLRPMPEMIVHSVVDGNLGPEIEKEKLEKQGVIREVELTLLMTLPVAKALLPLIQQMIDQLEGLKAVQKASVETSTHSE